jgi:hypothetical protein
MKIILENKTHWSTRDLRRFVTRVASDILHSDYRAAHSHLRVRFAHYSGRGETCSGHAVLGGSFAHIGVPKEHVHRADLALTVAHEFGHLLGLQHGDMSGGALWMPVGDWRERYAWAETFPLNRQPIRVRPSREQRREEKRVRLAARLLRWERRARRAAKAIRTLRRQLARMSRETRDPDRSQNPSQRGGEVHGNQSNEAL